MESKKRRLPTAFKPGTRVRGIYTGEVNSVSVSYWQNYAGGDTLLGRDDRAVGGAVDNEQGGEQRG